MKRVQRGRDLFSGEAQVTAVVAFSARIKRWIRERYPDGEERDDGRYIVRFPVADQRWLAREVLQYGAEAEVLELGLERLTVSSSRCQSGLGPRPPRASAKAR